MRLVIQRVTEACVKVDDEVVGQIGRGLCVLAGLCRDDTDEDMEFCVRKLLSLRLFDHEGKAWDKNVKEADLEILCVSQFTLYAVTKKGSKPDFHQAMSTEPSRAMYSTFLERLGKVYSPSKIQNGQFGAMMQVGLVNDGPVTITLDSRNR